MLKRISVLALAGLLGLPAVSPAASPDDLAKKIDQLTKELNDLRKQMEELKSSGKETASAVQAMEGKVEAQEAGSRFQLSGDFRSRIDGMWADTPTHYEALDIGQGIVDFYKLNTDFGRAFAGLSAAQQSAFASMTKGDFFTAYAGGFTPTGTATGSALTAFNTINSSLSSTQQSAFSAFLGAASVPMATTMGQVAMGFNTALGSEAIVQQVKPVADLMKTLTASERAAVFSALGYNTTAAADYDNDTLWSNRFRVNVRAKATENLTFKGRLAMYKAWGMQNNPVDYTFNNSNGGGPFMLSSLGFDGSSSRQPSDSAVLVDRAYINWDSIGGAPVWFSIGRRPTTDGPPGHLRQGLDERMATPTAYMDYPFDGLTLGYAYENLFGIQDAPGRIRFCYGRGFDSGPTKDGDGLKDVDFAGISWDVYNKANRFFAIQSFAAFDMFNVPDDIRFVNPIEFYLWQNNASYYNPLDPTRDTLLNRVNLGNIYHTTAVYMNKINSLDYFLSMGWSRTDARGWDELGTSLLGSFYDAPEDKDGYSAYAGIRYGLEKYRLKLGLEYNYGSENWIAFTPGHDDMYQSKLATRGHAAEAYMVYQLPAGEKISQYADFFMRLGYIHLWYDYTGSGFWLGKPIKIDDLKNDPLSAQFYTPIDELDQVYLTLDAYF